PGATPTGPPSTLTRVGIDGVLHRNPSHPSPLSPRRGERETVRRAWTRVTEFLAGCRGEDDSARSRDARHRRSSPRVGERTGEGVHSRQRRITYPYEPRQRGSAREGSSSWPSGETGGIPPREDRLDQHRREGRRNEQPRAD